MSDDLLFGPVWVLDGVAYPSGRRLICLSGTKLDTMLYTFDVEKFSVQAADSAEPVTLTLCCGQDYHLHSFVLSWFFVPSSTVM